MTVAKVVLLALAIKPFVATDYDSQPDLHEWDQKNISHNLILGQQGYEDRLLYHSFVHVGRRLFQTVHSNISYLSHGTSPFNITCIEVIDMKRDGTGGYPSVQHGGIGYNYTTINLVSQTSHGLHFNISIYGSIPNDHK